MTRRPFPSLSGISSISPFRRTLIPGFDEAEALANSCGCVAFFISGAGPTLLCLSADPILMQGLPPA